MGERLDTYLMLARGRDAGDQFARESAGGAAREQLAAWSAMARRRGMSLVLEAPAQASTADPDDAPAGAAQADPPRFSDYRELAATRRPPLFLKQSP